MDDLRRYIKLVLERIRSSKGEHFDLERFKKLSKLDDRINYANTNLDQIGVGSSRVVYVFNSKRVLKLALNDAGIAQNEEEVNVYTNPKTKSIVTQIYDYDTNYEWIISETARSISVKEFDNIAGLTDEKMSSFNEFTWDAVIGDFEIFEQFYQNKPNVLRLANAIHSIATQNKLAPGDIAKIDSWGKTASGRLVLLDYGLSYDVFEDYY